MSHDQDSREASNVVQREVLTAARAGALATTLWFADWAPLLQIKGFKRSDTCNDQMT